jgi:hypothetical protein
MVTSRPSPYLPAVDGALSIRVALLTFASLQRVFYAAWRRSVSFCYAYSHVTTPPSRPFHSFAGVPKAAEEEED